MTDGGDDTNQDAAGHDSRPHGVLVVALTGGIGSGKSTALAMFGERGASVVSADRLVREAYALPEVRRAVAERLGGDVLLPDGTIDLAWVADRVFRVPQERLFLEGLLHPMVWDRLDAFVSGVPAGTIVVAEIPLLFEADRRDRFDVTLAVGARPDVRRSRIAGRFSAEDIARREAAQVSDDERRRLADYFFVNDGSEADLRAWVDSVWDELRRRQEDARGADRRTS